MGTESTDRLAGTHHRDPIRGLEHTAAASWLDLEQTWLDGWLLRTGDGASCDSNSAMPLSILYGCDSNNSQMAPHPDADTTAGYS
ncbi:GNAT family N-acetyltransferase, cg3035/Rv0428c family [Mycobacterium lepromatosis]|uniref:GNAT family N-acetyltransferase, cg3035/Rv0428c family n=1 Tax=Mycobacterium lepromatosis TaxID=480418 RepID=UPI003B4FFEF3